MQNSGDRETPQPRPRRLILVGALALVIAIVIAVTGILARTHGEAELARKTDREATPTVAVIRPERGVKPQELVLPGDVEAWYQAPIYARVPGYLKMWYKDIGAPVKAGDLLGAIETPDLDQQLDQAKAALAEAVANEKLAIVTAQRWHHLLASDSVSQQDADVKASDAAAKQAQVQAAQANVSRIEALEGFKRLVAPFDGVVTARKTDVGALITVGAGSGPELFSVADLHEMRVYVQVPQAFSAQVTKGMQARLRLPQYPDRFFPATLATTASSINPTSRTLLVELHAPNPHYELSPGTYAEVLFELPPDPNSLRVPTSTLIFQEHGLEVATVDKSNRIALKKVAIGMDLGTEVQVVSGLAANDRVVDSPPDSLSAGDLVRVTSDTGAPPGRLEGPERVSEADK
jgi:RND family efflux transporter MFP subunit